LPVLRIIKFIAIIAAITLVISVFCPWVIITSRDLVITGMDTGGTGYGKPGYFHLVMAAAFLGCLFTPRIWAKRLNLLVTALNVAWAVRNYFIFSACSGGECPLKQTGLFLVLAASLIMLAGALFPDTRLENLERKKTGEH
jgi:hypothetical protein